MLKLVIIVIQFVKVDKNVQQKLDIKSFDTAQTASKLANLLHHEENQDDRKQFLKLYAKKYGLSLCDTNRMS